MKLGLDREKAEQGLGFAAQHQRKPGRFARAGDPTQHLAGTADRIGHAVGSQAAATDWIQHYFQTSKPQPSWSLATDQRGTQFL